MFERFKRKRNEEELEVSFQQLRNSSEAIRETNRVGNKIHREDKNSYEARQRKFLENEALRVKRYDQFVSSNAISVMKEAALEIHKNLETGVCLWVPERIDIEVSSRYVIYAGLGWKNFNTKFKDSEIFKGYFRWAEINGYPEFNNNVLVGARFSGGETIDIQDKKGMALELEHIILDADSVTQNTFGGGPPAFRKTLFERV